MSEYKESIRKNLQMIEDHLGQLNEFALQFIDPKETQRMIGIWRWYVSHDYFKQGDPRPAEPLFSNPPVTWLDGQLKGQSTPLGKDIGICISPIVQSGLMTEHAARRIMDRLKTIYQYISQEAAKAHAEGTYKKKVLDKINMKKHAEYEKARREREKKKKYTPEYIRKIADDAMKLKNRQRADAKKRHEEAQKESLRRFNEETERLKRSGIKT